MKIRLLAAAFLATFAIRAAAAEDARPAFGNWGIDLTAMDTSVKPGEDFFLYANGAWLKTAQIPADRTSSGVMLDIQMQSETRMSAIVQELDAAPEAGLTPEEKKLRDFYDAYVDTAAIEKAGLAPARKDLARLAGIKTDDDVARAMASIPLATESLFNIGIDVDDKNPSAYAVGLSQSGLGLPDRDFYLRNDGPMPQLRDAYKAYLAKMLTLLGEKDADARAAAIFALETEMAKVEWSRADRRDRDKVYNPMSVSQLEAYAPGFAWRVFLSEAGVPLKAATGERTVIVAEKTAFPPLAKLLAATPIPVWRDYLTVHYLRSYAAVLPAKFDDATFAFYGTMLRGQAQQLPRGTRAVRMLNASMGEALGKLYVARYFPPESKAKALTLVGNLLKAYEADMETLTWMTDATRTKAIAKLHAYTLKIGYPDHWRDYAALKIARGKALADTQNATAFEWQRQLKRLDGPVDRSEWALSPQTVNAYYNPSFNEIVFPAAILQPPFFDPHADDAVNYGGIGAVIGHEISHGFDDQGSKYDGTGALNDWWTDADRQNFVARTQALSAQFDAYEPLPGLHVIGKNTLGENIADLAGLTIALKAYHLSLGGQPAPVLDGFTGDQRFFLSFGQIWRTKMQDGAIRTQTLSDPHTVSQFRVIGATRNIDGWYDAFGVQAGDKYYLPPEARVHLW